VRVTLPRETATHSVRGGVPARWPGAAGASFDADDDFAGFGAALLEVSQGFAGLVEVEDGVHDRPDGPGVDEGGEFA